MNLIINKNKCLNNQKILFKINRKYIVQTLNNSNKRINNINKNNNNKVKIFKALLITFSNPSKKV